jgi:transcriptional repressor NrdR
MKCPFCKNSGDRVVDSRSSGDSIRRRRECGACKRRFTTYEYVEMAPLTVVKRDGSREPFNRGKLLSGLQTACIKRPITRAQIDSVVSDIENELATGDDQEVGYEMLGNLIMERLFLLDEVAYVRFASVYRRFKEMGQFMDEIKQISP